MTETNYQESTPTAAGGGSSASSQQSTACNNEGAHACKSKKTYSQLSFEFVEDFAVKQRGGI